MTERNPYSQQNNYDTYDQSSFMTDGQEDPFTLREKIVARMSTPMFATVALLITAAAFAGIIALSYPESPGAGGDVPVIRAASGDLYQPPPENTGLAIAQANTTLFSNIRASDLKETAPVEDLLAKEKPIDKLEAFAKEAQSTYDEDAENSDDAATTEITENVDTDAPEGGRDGSPRTIKIQQQVEKIPPRIETPGSERAASAQIKQPAGSAPETLAFVKSVLNEKDGKVATRRVISPQEMAAAADDEVPPAPEVRRSGAQRAVQQIEPAAGAASSAMSAAGSGSYYVQLGSVTSEGGTAAEWKHLQKTFGVLQSAQYRVQRADLGEKGVRYRIQAGPMSKEMAASVCGSIKAAKPGGCLVVR